jgi:putative ABC transport system permease protein
MFQRPRKASDFNAETEAHIQLEIDRLRESGLSADEAHAAAHRAFGNLAQAHERFHEARRWIWWDGLRQDVRFGLRMLGKTPGFTAVAVLTLALGIGATTVIFSAVYAVLLKPLPFRDPGRLVFIEKKNPPRGWVRNPVSPAEILAWRNQTGAFEDVAAFRQTSCVMNAAGEAEEDPCEVASSNLFPLLGASPGASPIMGRNFSAAEDQAEGPRVAILSYGLWQRRFGADASAIGRTIDINHASYTIVGVMPANFSHLYGSPYGTVPAMWICGIGLSPASTWNDYFAIGRLKPGTNLQQAAAQMDQVSLRIDRAFPELKGWRPQLMSIRTMVSGDTRPALVVLMGAVIFVLLIACANMANLLLARGASRATEFAVRNALGAGEARMVRQLLTESLMITLAGGVLGVLLASWGCQAMAALAPQSLLNSAPGLASGVADLRVLAFALTAILATTFLFGLAPALQSARPHLTETLKETGRDGAQSPQSGRLRSTLVVSEIALAMVLLVGAGLMVRTLAHLSQVNLGFNPAHVLTLRVPLSGERYEQPQAQVEFWDHVVAATKALPGVEAASVSRDLPIDGWAGQFFTTSDRPNPPAGQVPDANYVVVGPDYFRTLQIPLRRGRSFNQHDTQAAGRVAIVNEELARLYWPGQDPLGKQLRPGSPGNTEPWLSVVGVAGNIHSQGPDTGFHAEIYIPHGQFPWMLRPEHLVVRTAATVKPESVVRAVVQVVHHVDQGLPVADIVTMEQLARAPLVEQRMVMALMVSFAGLALVLSALGTYSVLSYSIAQRTREIGLRMALGAQRGNVLRLIVGGSVRLALMGIAVGTAGALALTRLMTGLLFGVRATDPATFCAVIAMRVAATLLASYIPARRAIRVDPIVALRHA